MNYPWTDDELAKVKRLWPTGKSASEIAREMPGRSRAAVIGMVHRLGISVREKPEVPTSRAPTVKRDRYAGNGLNVRGGKKTARSFVGNKSKSDSTPKQRVEKVAAGRAIIKKASDAANDNAVPLLTRGFGKCAWPVGTPARAADQLACGAPIYQGIEKCSYCLDHAQRAFARDITLPKPKENLERANRRWAA